jgi:hypothetical protein
VDSVAFEYFPAGQLGHVDAPCKLYVPGVHDEQLVRPTLLV